MKNIIITYSNGDREKSSLGENVEHMIDGIIASGFKIAWTSRDELGRYTHVTNMEHVRSIEIVDEEESEVGVD